MLGKNCDFGVYFFVTRSYQTCTRILDSVPSTKKEKSVKRERGGNAKHSAYNYNLNTQEQEQEGPKDPG